MPLWLGVCILVVCGLVAYGTVRFYKIEGESASAPALNALTVGDFSDAIAMAEQVLQSSNPKNSDYQTAQSVIGASQFFSGDATTSVAAVQIAKRQFVAAVNNLADEAHIVNVLIGYANSTRNPKVLAEIFKDPPFSSMLVSSSITDSLKNLADYSLSLSKTSSALFEVGNWHATQIVKGLNGTAKLSDAEIAMHVQAISDVLLQADGLRAAEAAAQQNAAFGFFFEPRFSFSEGHLYGILSLIDKTYLPQVETNFNAVIADYESMRNPDGSHIALLEPRIPYAHLEEALFINAATGASRASDVSAHLDAIVLMIRANPATHQKFFTAFMQSLAKPSPSVSYITHDRVAQLAAINANFKAFLIENGWTF